VEAAGERVHVTTVALCEAVWTLTGRRYGWDRVSIVSTLSRLLAADVFDFQDRDAVYLALADYSDGLASFADALIGQLGRRSGCSDTVTFDRALYVSPHFAPVPDLPSEPDTIHELSADRERP
jgi:predicted nucleic-acid-binding protein